MSEYTINEPSHIERDGVYVSQATALAKRRVLTLKTPIAHESVMPLIESMVLLEHEDSKAPITLFISSPGGSVYSGLALIDVMQNLSCPVHTVGSGIVASMASVVLACGEKRSLYRNAFVLIHQLMGGMPAMAQQTDMQIALEHSTELRSVLDNLLAERGTKSAQEYHKLTERDCWCNAERALELGLVDEIIRPIKASN